MASNLVKLLVLLLIASIAGILKQIADCICGGDGNTLPACPDLSICPCPSDNQQILTFDSTQNQIVIRCRAVTLISVQPSDTYALRTTEPARSCLTTDIEFPCTQKGANVFLVYQGNVACGAVDNPDAPDYKFSALQGSDTTCQP